MSKKRNQRRPWTTEEENLLQDCVVRGRSLKTAMGTASVKLGRTRAACQRWHYKLLKRGQTRPEMPAIQTEAVKGSTFSRPVEVRIDGKFKVSLRDGILHLS